MEHQDHEESVQFADVQMIRDTGLTWLFLIDGKQVAVPPHLVLAGSTIAWPRARRGKVVIPKSLAMSLGLGVTSMDRYPPLQERMSDLRSRLRLTAGILVAPLVITGYMGLTLLLFLPLLGLRTMFPR